MTKNGDKSGKFNISFTQLKECDSKLDINREPSVIRYSQISPIIKHDKYGKKNLYFNPYHPFQNLTDKQKESASKKIAATLHDKIPIIKQINSGLLPDPSSKNRVKEKIQLLAKNKILTPKQKINFDENEVHKIYQQFINDIEKNQNKLFINNIHPVIQISEKDLLDTDKLSKAISSSTLFQPYFTYSSKYSVGLFVTYEQEWHHLGYSRGELIKTLELAPGETVTLEYHYWDKSIIKNENELSTELELKSSSTLTQRDTKQILDELTSNNQLHLNAHEGGGIKIPDTPISLEASADGGISSQLQPHISNTISNTTESVVSTTNDFKQNRKIRIEETRDSGIENKQTRVVSNTNRCHTVQYNYFEIISNYQIVTRLSTIRPCILLPYSVIYDKKPLTPKRINYNFILCHEHVLKSALLDKLFLPGFEAAKKIASFNKVKKLIEGEFAQTGTSDSASTSTTQNLESEFAEYRKQIIDDFNKILDSQKPFVDFANDLDLSKVDDTVIKVTNFIIELLNHPSQARHVLYLISLSLKNDAFNALKALKKSKDDNKPAERAMIDFFAKVDEDDYQFLDPVSGEISKFFQSFGVPNDAADLLAGIVEFFLSTEAAAIAGAIIGTLIEPGIGTVIGAGIGAAVGAALQVGGGTLLASLRDDAGLHTDVEAAQSFFKNTKLSPTGAVNENLSSTSPDSSPAAYVKTIADFVSVTDIADANVELERLICHIKCNFEHYKQALWSSKDADYRTYELIKNGFYDYVINEVLGFASGYVAYPLRNMDFVDELIDVNILKKNLKKIKEESKEQSAVIMIPTSSTIITGQLGECDLCEDYIDRSRDADIRQQNAKAALDEAEIEYKKAKTKVIEQEALRIAARLNATPPDLTDPIEHNHAKFDITITHPDDNPGE
ncbi:Uncharacterised protein [Legionella lansingensis]|uniref:Uncharacterized protein n=1 Tax=Legionella lansingensis TaxID=45067 RepID=A0A0W0VV18_9GAMM|nr:hypothetical protein [Legionella lansingensis]KTD23903.1 hypothetical protein Llan_0684 [Legionella lansingensis]SNV46381.1 Uncharacterised protein [Legionella lansingensis]